MVTIDHWDIGISVKLDNGTSLEADIKRIGDDVVCWSFENEAKRPIYLVNIFN